MSDENPTPDPVAEANAIERDVLYLLTGDDSPLIWSVWDLGRATERGKCVKDTIRSLRVNGLVNQSERRARVRYARGLPHGADRRRHQLTSKRGATPQGWAWRSIPRLPGGR